MQILLKLLGLALSCVALVSCDQKNSDPTSFRTVENLATEENLRTLEAEAETIVGKFVAELKPTLKKTIEEQGSIAAIQVCSITAPMITKKISLESGWQVKRVSLKPRNKQSAIPSDWEEKILEQFDQQPIAAMSSGNLQHAEIIDGQFRFLKAQKVESICLLCHGETIDHKLSLAIREFYPDDEATGYSLGQVRGAFSLSRDL